MLPKTQISFTHNSFKRRNSNKVSAFDGEIETRHLEMNGAVSGEAPCNEVFPEWQPVWRIRSLLTEWPLGCRRVDMPGMCRCTRCPTKGPNGGFISTPLPIKPLSLTSSARHLHSNRKGLMCMFRADAPALSNRASSTWLELQSL